MPEKITETKPLLPERNLDSLVLYLDASDEGELQVAQEGQALDGMSRQEKLNAAMQLVTSPLTGAGSAYSTFGPIAMLYYQGLWLLAPVSTGAAISVSDAAFSLLTKKYPDIPLLNKLQEGMKFSNRMVVGFFADFGFNWNLIKTTAIFAGGKDYAHNVFAKVIAPMLSLLPAALTRSVRYKQATGQLAERSVLRHIASTIRGATSTSAIMSTLMIQGLIDVDSVIPITTYIVMGTLALAASLCQEQYPMPSQVIMASINILAENTSLSVLSFALLNDIYAAVNDWDVDYAYFYTNAAVNFLYYILLTSMTLSMICTPRQPELTDEPDMPWELSWSSDEEVATASSSSSANETTELVERRNSTTGMGLFRAQSAADEKLQNPATMRRYFTG